MAKPTLLISVVLLVICIQGTYGCGGSSSNHYESNYYTEVNDVSPDEVAERLTPKLQQMANALVNTTAEQSTKEIRLITSKLNDFKGEIEGVLNAHILPESQEAVSRLRNMSSKIEMLQQQMLHSRAHVILYLRENLIISEYIQSLCRLIYEDVRGQSMTLREIMVKIIETYDMTAKNSDKLDETRQAIADNKGEVLKVEDETFAIYELLVKIRKAVDKVEEMWTTGQVELIVVPLSVVTGLLILGIVGFFCRYHTKTEMRLNWLTSFVGAQGWCSREVKTNNYDQNNVKKTIEYVNPLVAKGPDNYF